MRAPRGTGMDGMTKQTPSSLLLVATIAGGIGFVAFVALMVVGDFTFSPAAFLALVVGLAAAIVLFQGFHRASPADRTDPRSVGTSEFGDVTRKPGGVGREPGSAGVAPGSAGPQRVGATPAAAIDRTYEPDATGNATGGAPSAELGGMPDPAAGGVPGKEADQGIRADSFADDGGRPAPAPDGDSSVADNADAGSSAPEPQHGADAAKEASERDVSPAAKETGEHSSATGGPGHQPDAGSEGRKWSSSQVAGTQELADRKGTWRYEPGDGDEVSARASTEETVIGTEPKRLSGPPEDGGDDLKRISGVGPKLETMLHGLGIYRFDQIAGWSDQEVAWIDERLEGFKGRVRRDEWVRQAGELSGRGPTPA